MTEKSGGLPAEAAMPDTHEIRGLYAFGSNGSGQLGIGNTADTSKPQQLLGAPGVLASDITCITAGGNHTVVRFGSDKLAAAGDNSDGRCIVAADAGAKGFADTLVTADHKGLDDTSSKRVAAMWSATVIVCDDKLVYTFGTGGFGELGGGTACRSAQEPVQLTDFPPGETRIVALAAGMAHIVVVLDNGEAWGWGKGRKGQLGMPAEVVWQPRKIQGTSFRVSTAVCGKDFSILFGDRDTGEYRILGDSLNDRFGLFASAPASLPVWKHVHASWGSVFVHLETDKILAWGRNDHGQFGPSDLPLLKAMAAGSEHCLGITQTGKLIAWGWGEHGNCGPSVDAQGDVKGRWNEVELPAEAVDVYAGCATSYVITRPSR